MVDITTKYIGLQLKNPIIAGSSGLSGNIEGVKKLVDNNVGAIVLKSLFEEQITHEAYNTVKKTGEDFLYPEAVDYIKNYTKSKSVNQYIDLISAAKKYSNTPIIASVNCVSDSEWTDFAKQIENAGADALELNVFILPSDNKMSSEENEKIYFRIIEKVRKLVKIPLALKMSYYSSGLTQLIEKISWTKNVDGIVMFNRSFSPDIDINTMKIHSTNVFSTPEEIATSLRWVAIMRDRISCDIAATTGIHNGEGVIKQILAGANAVQVASVLYKKGPEFINIMISEIEQWMTNNKFKSLNDFRGKMSQSKTENPAAFERVQFMKYFSNIE